jgi:hypothetical protein
MANKKKLFGMLTMVSAFGLVLAGCPAGEDVSSSNQTNQTSQRRPGLLKIINGSSFEIKNVSFETQSGSVVKIDTTAIHSDESRNYEFDSAVSKVKAAVEVAYQSGEYLEQTLEINCSIGPGYTYNNDYYDSKEVILSGTNAASLKLNSGNETSNPMLTGIVTITRTGMRLDADTSELGGSGTVSYQWTRNSEDIDGADNSAYTIKDLDFEKTIKVKVRRYGYSGFIEGRIAISTPKTYTIKLKYDPGAYYKQKVEIKDPTGSAPLNSTPESPIDVNTFETTVAIDTLDSSFKIKIYLHPLFYKNGGVGGPEIFNFQEGTTPVYTLMNERLDTAVPKDLVATQE